MKALIEFHPPNHTMCLIDEPPFPCCPYHVGDSVERSFCTLFRCKDGSARIVKNLKRLPICRDAEIQQGKAK